MRRNNRELNIFSLSAIDLFCSALGAILILTIVLLPYYRKELRVRDLDMAILIDTTGSMGEQIEELQGSIDSTVVALQRMCRNLRIGVVAYKDFDSKEGVNGYQTKTYPMTRIARETQDGGRSIEQLAEFVNGLDASGGGATVHEDLDVALDEALKMPWAAGSGGTMQVIVMIADVGVTPEQESGLLSTIRTWSEGGKDRRLVAIFTATDAERREEHYPSFERMAEAAGSRGISHAHGGRLLGSILDVVLQD